MKSRRFLSLVLIAAMLLGLTGCFEKPMDAATLAEKMTEAVTATPATAMTMGMEMDMEMTMSGVSIDMSMDGDAEVKTSMEPLAGYTKMDMNVDAMGQKQDMEMEMYYGMEDGALVSYVYESATDTWTRSALEEAPDMSQLESVNLAELDPETLTLAEEKQTIGEREVYVLSGTMTGEQIQGTLATTMGAMTADMDEQTAAIMEEMDFSALTVPFVYYIDCETFLPLKQELQIQGMGDMMTDLFSVIMTEALGGADLGYDMEITVDIPTVTVVMEEISYEAVEVPTVPQEGIEGAAMNPDRGDGTYLLHQDDSAVLITPPQTLTMLSVDQVSLMLADGEYAQYVMFMLDAEATEEGHQAYMDSYVAAYADTEHETGSGEDLNGFAYEWLTAPDGAVAYAWKDLGGVWLGVEVMDTTGGDVVELLTSVLEGVENYN